MLGMLLLLAAATAAAHIASAGTGPAPPLEHCKAGTPAAAFGSGNPGCQDGKCCAAGTPPMRKCINSTDCLGCGGCGYCFQSHTFAGNWCSTAVQRLSCASTVSIACRPALLPFAGVSARLQSQVRQAADCLPVRGRRPLHRGAGRWCAARDLPARLPEGRLRLPGSRRRDCHLLASPLHPTETPAEGRGGCSGMKVSPTATPARTSSASRSPAASTRPRARASASPPPPPPHLAGPRLGTAAPTSGGCRATELATQTHTGSTAEGRR